MSDFPQVRVPPTHIHSFSQWFPIGSIRGGLGLSTQNPTSMAWGGANTALYMPFSIPWPYEVNRFFWGNGSVVASSNHDVGVYTHDGARICSTGSTAASGASAIQYANPTATAILSPGEYYLAYTNNGTTNRVIGNAWTATQLRMLGTQQQGTALPLPATATFAQTAIIGWPLCGFTRWSTGF